MQNLYGALAMQWNGVDFQSFHGSSASHTSSHQHISENHFYIPLLNTRYQSIRNSDRAATIPSWINCHIFPFPLQATFWIDIIFIWPNFRSESQCQNHPRSRAIHILEEQSWTYRNQTHTNTQTACQWHLQIKQKPRCACAIQQQIL